MELRRDERTRGHGKKIFKDRARLEIRKNSFCHRIVNDWNALPSWVIEAANYHIFERRLDMAWRNQDLLYNYRAKIDPTFIVDGLTDTTANTEALRVNSDSELDSQA